MTLAATIAMTNSVHDPGLMRQQQHLVQQRQQQHLQQRWQWRWQQQQRWQWRWQQQQRWRQWQHHSTGTMASEGVPIVELDLNELDN